MNINRWLILQVIAAIIFLQLVKPLGWLWGSLTMLLLLIVSGKALDYFFPEKSED